MEISLTEDVSFLAAFFVGLLGGVHCVGMCGGVVGALTFGLPEQVRGRASRVSPFLLAYNAGRIASYTLAGAMMGGVGWFAANLTGVHETQVALKLFAGLFMIALGLYLAGWWQGLARVERMGGVLWRRLEPLGRRIVPVTTPTRALAAGLVWGWLPCGLVYSVLIWSIAAGGFVEGALLMLSFGLGTLPNLMAMGLFASQLARFVRNPRVKAIAGALVMGFGAYYILSATA